MKDLAGSSAPLERNGWIAGVVVTGLGALWLATRSGPEPDSLSSMLSLVWVILTSLPLTMLWLACAAGYGHPLRRWLAPATNHPRLLQLAIGIAFLLWLDATLGRLGALQFGGSLGAWLVTAAGCAVLALQVAQNRAKLAGRGLRIPWLVWTAAPALAVVIVAACSAPGWLWSTEFGGYDALSYHLQLPKEWLARGRIEPLEHNVYSFLPGYVEAAYYHLAVLRGDAVEASYACQMLHASFAIFTAITAYRIAQRHAPPIAGPIAFVLVIGTGWTIVAGSLAYNEMAVTFLFGVMLLMFLADEPPAESAGWRMPMMLGFFAGCAMGAKLTAIGFVAVPLAIACAMRLSPRHWPKWIALGAAAALFALSPYLIGNLVACGNPVFPFATSIFGSAHWTGEQVDIWRSAHYAATPTGARLIEAFHQFVRFGWGPNPYENEPWRPQWALLPIAALAAAAYACFRPRIRGICGVLVVVLIAQVLFWLFFTHIKSRFMLPAIVPMSVIVAIATSDALAMIRGRWASPLVALALVAHACLPVWVFLRERNGQPAAALGATELFRGDVHQRSLNQTGLNDAELAALRNGAPMSFWINHVLSADARILSIGEAAPFYLRTDVHYQTTWDRGPMSRLMRQFPDDPAAWRSELAQQYTHLLVDPVMLRVWERSGWNDPLITSDRVVRFADGHARLIHIDQHSSARLYELDVDE